MTRIFWGLLLVLCMIFPATLYASALTPAEAAKTVACMDDVVQKNFANDADDSVRYAHAEHLAIGTVLTMPDGSPRTLKRHQTPWGLCAKWVHSTARAAEKSTAVVKLAPLQMLPALPAPAALTELLPLPEFKQYPAPIKRTWFTQNWLSLVCVLLLVAVFVFYVANRRVRHAKRKQQREKTIAPAQFPARVSPNILRCPEPQILKAPSPALAAANEYRATGSPTAFKHLMSALASGVRVHTDEGTSLKIPFETASIAADGSILFSGACTLSTRGKQKRVVEHVPLAELNLKRREISTLPHELWRQPELCGHLKSIGLVYEIVVKDMRPDFEATQELPVLT